MLLRTPVLGRASEPMAMPLGTLAALHLATALIWRDRMGSLPALATHDTTLGQAAGIRIRSARNLNRILEQARTKHVCGAKS
ncbi:MAG: hypothetical protein WBC51_07500 [Vicinamibacterales bacterium]